MVPDGEKTLRICVTVYSTEYRHVTDEQTDRHLANTNILLYFGYAHESRGKNYENYSTLVETRAYQSWRVFFGTRCRINQNHS